MIRANIRQLLLTLAFFAALIVWAATAPAASFFSGPPAVNKAGDTMTGTLVVPGTTVNNGADFVVQAGAVAPTDPGDIIFNDNAGAEIGRIWKGAGENKFYVRFDDTGTAPNGEIWHSGNDGDGSGSDADLWKGRSYIDYSVVYDSPSIAASTCRDESGFSVIAGAEIGDFVLASTNTTNGGYRVFGSIYPATGLNMTLCNWTDFTFDPPPMTYYFRVFKRQ
jgi:hypothetical protein